MQEMLYWRPHAGYGWRHCTSTSLHAPAPTKVKRCGKQRTTHTATDSCCSAVMGRGAARHWTPTCDVCYG